MKYLLEIEEGKASMAEEFFKCVSFIRGVKAIQPNEITNPSILKSIEQYENGTVKPTPLSMIELKEMLHV